jgi:hypothetical protein
MDRAVRVNRPYQIDAIIDMIAECPVSRVNVLITRHISPDALAQSISSRFAVTGADLINFAMTKRLLC